MESPHQSHGDLLNQGFAATPPSVDSTSHPPTEGYVISYLLSVDKNCKLTAEHLNEKWSQFYPNVANVQCRLYRLRNLSEDQIKKKQNKIFVPEKCSPAPSSDSPGVRLRPEGASPTPYVPLPVASASHHSNSSVVSISTSSVVSISTSSVVSMSTSPVVPQVNATPFKEPFAFPSPTSSPHLVRSSKSSSKLSSARVLFPVSPSQSQKENHCSECELWSKRLAQSKKTIGNVRSELAELNVSYSTQLEDINKLKRDDRMKLIELKNEHKDKISKLKENHKNQLLECKNEHVDKISKLKEKHEIQLLECKTEHAGKISKLKVENEIQLLEQANAYKRQKDIDDDTIEVLSKHIEKLISMCKQVGEAYASEKSAHVALRLENNNLISRLAASCERNKQYAPGNVDKQMCRLREKNHTLQTRQKDLKEQVKVVTAENESLKMQNNTIAANLEDVIVDAADVLKSTQDDLARARHSKKVSLERCRKRLISKSDQVDDLSEQCKKARAECLDKDRLIEYLSDIAESDVVKTFENGRYTDEVRQCCIELYTEKNVPLSKLSEVITSVLGILVGKVPERLPSKSLLSWLTIEADVIAKSQVQHNMLKADPSAGTGNVLHQDATTRWHNHYEGMQFVGLDGSMMSMGLKLVSGSDHEKYVQAFKDIIEELALCSSTAKSEKCNIVARLICSFKAFMNDQCASNALFVSAIHNFRVDLLPQVIDNFDRLSSERQDDIRQTGSFHCRMHLIANFAPAADNGCKMVEEASVTGKNPHALESDENSSVLRLARTAAKMGTRRGCDKSGKADLWEAYLEEKERPNMLKTFSGHRINIAFYNCAAVVYHRHDLVDFLAKYDTKNNLLKCVEFDINEPLTIAGCRAMGIIFHLVTNPFWRLLDSCNILDLNEHLKILRDALEAWSDDGSLPLSGKPVFKDPSLTFGRVSSERGPLDCPLAECMFGEFSAEIDGLTKCFLELIALNMLILLEKQAEKQLPGGKYWDAGENVKKLAANVKSTNVGAERDMAILDGILKTKPAATPATVECLAMCMSNKPSHWLRSLSPEDRQSEMENARKKAPLLKDLIRKRALRHKADMASILKSKEAAIAEKAEKKSQRVIRLTNAISNYGGVWSLESVSTHLERICDLKEQRNAVLSQLHFHRDVIGSSCAKHLFYETHQSQKRSIDDLTKNLKEVIAEGVNFKDTEDPTQNRLTYNSIENVVDNLELNRSQLLKKMFDQRQKFVIDKEKEKLPNLMKHPEQLVSKSVEHRLSFENKENWFLGEVLEIVKSHENPLKISFKVKYQDGTWEFPLLQDLKNGDLIIKSQPINSLQTCATD